LARSISRKIILLVLSGGVDIEADGIYARRRLRRDCCNISGVSDEVAEPGYCGVDVSDSFGFEGGWAAAGEIIDVSVS